LDKYPYGSVFMAINDAEDKTDIREDYDYTNEREVAEFEKKFNIKLERI